MNLSHTALSAVCKSCDHLFRSAVVKPMLAQVPYLTIDIQPISVGVGTLGFLVVEIYLLCLAGADVINVMETDRPLGGCDVNASFVFV